MQTKIKMRITMSGRNIDRRPRWRGIGARVDVVKIIGNIRIRGRVWAIGFKSGFSSRSGGEVGRVGEGLSHSEEASMFLSSLFWLHLPCYSQLSRVFTLQAWCYSNALLYRGSCLWETTKRERGSVGRSVEVLRKLLLDWREFLVEENWFKRIRPRRTGSDFRSRSRTRSRGRGELWMFRSSWPTRCSQQFTHSSVGP